MKTEWAPVFYNVDGFDEDMRMKTVRLILGVSRGKGIEAAHFNVE